jgi:hypothetical protein
MKNYLRIPADKIVEFASSQENYNRVATWGCVIATMLAIGWIVPVLGYALIH